MDAWVWWLLITLALVGFEVVTGAQLVFLMLAAGTAVAAVAAVAGAGAGVQFVLVAVVSVVSLGLVRPVARRHLRQPIETRTGVDALIGKDALVLERVDGRDGRVKLGGEIWSARSYDGSALYEPDQTVQVVAVQGATVLVG